MSPATRGDIVFTLANVGNTGAPQMAGQFARALRRSGYAVTVAHGGSSDDIRRSRVLQGLAEADVRCVHVPQLAFPVGPGLPRQIAALAPQADCRAVVGVTQRDRCVALLAAAAHGVPGILSVQNQHRFNGPRPLASLKEAYYRRVVRRHCALAVCTSDKVRLELVERFGVEPSRLTVLPNGIDIERFAAGSAERRERTRAELAIEKDCVALVAVGRLEPQKGYEDMLEAIGQAAFAQRRVRLLIAGGGPGGTGRRADTRYADMLLAKVRERGLEERVRFLGEVDDVPSLLSAADVYVHSAHWEGWPLALLEAMAAGLPSVFTDCFGELTGFRQRVHGECVPTGDVAALAAAVSRMVDLPDGERRAIGAAAAQLVRGAYSIDVICRDFVKLVERRVAPGAGSG